MSSNVMDSILSSFLIQGQIQLNSKSSIFQLFGQLFVDSEAESLTNDKLHNILITISNLESSIDNLAITFSTQFQSCCFSKIFSVDSFIFQFLFKQEVSNLFKLAVLYHILERKQVDTVLQIGLFCINQSEKLSNLMNTIQQFSLLITQLQEKISLKFELPFANLQNIINVLKHVVNKDQLGESLESINDAMVQVLLKLKEQQPIVYEQQCIQIFDAICQQPLLLSKQYKFENIRALLSEFQIQQFQPNSFQMLCCLRNILTNVCNVQSVIKILQTHILDNILMSKHLHLNFQNSVATVLRYFDLSIAEFTSNSMLTYPQALKVIQNFDYITEQIIQLSIFVDSISEYADLVQQNIEPFSDLQEIIHYFKDAFPVLQKNCTIAEVNCQLQKFIKQIIVSNQIIEIQDTAPVQELSINNNDTLQNVNIIGSQQLQIQMDINNRNQQIHVDKQTKQTQDDHIQQLNKNPSAQELQQLDPQQIENNQLQNDQLEPLPNVDEPIILKEVQPRLKSMCCARIKYCLKHNEIVNEIITFQYQEPNIGKYSMEIISLLCELKKQGIISSGNTSFGKNKISFMVMK